MGSWGGVLNMCKAVVQRLLKACELQATHKPEGFNFQCLCILTQVICTSPGSLYLHSQTALAPTLKVLLAHPISGSFGLRLVTTAILILCPGPEG